MDPEEYKQFKLQWHGKIDFCETFIKEAIRHANRNLDICDDDDDCCHSPHPDGADFADMVSNYNKLIDYIEQLKKEASKKSCFIEPFRITSKTIT